MIINGFYVNTNVSSYVLTNLHQTDLCDLDDTYLNLCSFKLNRVYVVSSNLAVFFAGVEVFKLYSGLKREKGIRLPVFASSMNRRVRNLHLTRRT